MEIYNPFIVFLDTTQNLIYDHLENHQLRSKRSQMDIIPIGKSNIAVSNKKYRVNMGYFLYFYNIFTISVSIRSISNSKEKQNRKY